jgi:hypothetical protein
MTPSQKENIQFVSFGFIVLTMSLTMKWWTAPIVAYVASTFYGM